MAAYDTSDQVQAELLRAGVEPNPGPPRGARIFRLPEHPLLPGEEGVVWEPCGICNRVYNRLANSRATAALAKCRVDCAAARDRTQAIHVTAPTRWTADEFIADDAGAGPDDAGPAPGRRAQAQPPQTPAQSRERPVELDILRHQKLSFALWKKEVRCCAMSCVPVTETVCRRTTSA